MFDIHAALRRWSLWLVAAGTAMLAFFQYAPDQALQLWNLLPPEFQARVPKIFGLDVGFALIVLGKLAMFVKQKWVMDRLRAFCAWFRTMTADKAGEVKRTGGALTAAAVALIALVGPVAYDRLHQDVPKHEGTVYSGYLDPVKIPTKCSGDTTNVVVGRVYTDEECRVSLDTQLLAHARPVLACSPELRGRPYILAATIDLTYNIGASAYCRSTVAKRFRAGDFRGGCAAMSAWVYAGGRKLPGLVKRRADNRALCERGLS